jgi:hypothetical protein
VVRPEVSILAPRSDLRSEPGQLLTLPSPDGPVIFDPWRRREELYRSIFVTPWKLNLKGLSKMQQHSIVSYVVLTGLSAPEIQRS